MASERNDGKACVLCLGTPEQCPNDIACLVRLIEEVRDVTALPWYRRKRTLVTKALLRLRMLAMILQSEEKEDD